MIDGSISFDGVYAPDSGPENYLCGQTEFEFSIEPLIDAISFILMLCAYF